MGWYATSADVFSIFLKITPLPGTRGEWDSQTQATQHSPNPPNVCVMLSLDTTLISILYVVMHKYSHALPP